MIGFELLVRIRKEKRIEFLQLFEMAKTADSRVDGRFDLELFEKVSEPNTFLWREQWASDDSLQLYCKENKYRAIIGAINILGKLVHKNRFRLFEGE
jgi:quinol monooxygenase YgiN